MSDSHVELVAWRDRAFAESSKNINATFIATDSKIIKTIEAYIKISMKLNSPWQFKIFENTEDARKWLSC